MSRQVTTQNRLATRLQPHQQTCPANKDIAGSIQNEPDPTPVQLWLLLFGGQGCSVMSEPCDPGFCFWFQFLIIQLGTKTSITASRKIYQNAHQVTLDLTGPMGTLLMGIQKSCSG